MKDRGCWGKRHAVPSTMCIYLKRDRKLFLGMARFSLEIGVSTRRHARAAGIQFNSFLWVL